MIKRRSVPFEKRLVQPGAWEALDRAVEAGEKMRAAEAERKEQNRIRAECIVEARRLGLTLDDIARRFGISAERVRQISVIPEES